MTASRRSDLDAIVLDLDGGSMLEECLTSILRQDPAPSRVIVWDNGSRTPVTTRIPSLHRVEVFRSECNLGFAGGMNAALRETKADLVALVNNDVVLEPRWVAAVASSLDTHTRLGAVQSVVLQPDGLVDGAGIDISDGTIRQRGRGRPPEELSGSAWGISATAAIYRREALRSVARDDEVFDERFFAYYEDVELSARLLENGWELGIVPEGLAVHRGSATATALAGRALRLRVANRWLVHRMHPSVGRASALLAEDARQLSRALVRGRVVEALARLGAMIRGLTQDARQPNVTSNSGGS